MPAVTRLLLIKRSMLMIIRLRLSPVHLLRSHVEGCTTPDAPAPLTTVAALEAVGLTITDACTADANLVVTSSQYFNRYLSFSNYKNLYYHRCLR